MFKILNHFINKFLIIFITLIFSTSIHASVGDVYFCDEVSRVGYNEGDNDYTEYEPQKFKFKRLNDVLIFGSDGNWYDNVKLSVNFSSGELFSASNNDTATLHYEDGRFNYTYGSYTILRVMTGTCSPF